MCLLNGWDRPGRWCRCTLVDSCASVTGSCALAAEMGKGGPCVGGNHMRMMVGTSLLVVTGPASKDRETLVAEGRPEHASNAMGRGLTTKVAPERCGVCGGRTTAGYMSWSRPGGLPWSQSWSP